MTFSSNVVSSTEADTELTLTSLSQNTEYIWRVKATNGSAESAWSEAWSFTTESIIQYTLTVDIVGGGIIYVDDVEYTDPVTVDENTIVTLGVDFPLVWPFDHWEGDLTGDANPATLLMDENKNVTAIFVLVEVDHIKDEQNHFNIYPNPSAGLFTLEWNEVSLVEVYDITGKQIYSRNISNGTISIDISDSKPGMYLIKAYSEDEIITRKIIIE